MVNPSSVRGAPKLLPELVEGLVEGGERISGSPDGTDGRAPGMTRQLDVNALRRLPGIPLLAHLDIDAICLAIESREPIQLVLHDQAEPLTDRGVA